MVDSIGEIVGGEILIGTKQPNGRKSMKTFVAFSVAVVVASLIVAGSVQAADADSTVTVTVKGEVLDMACYLDHGAHGEKHAQCAATCIESGLPVGIKGEDGKTYLLIGEHKPLNSTLAQYAGKTITVKGKFVSRDGINMIENAEIQK
jgi:type 1 fimbria pilin